MPIWLQHLLVLTLVAACLFAVVRGTIRTLLTGKGKLGACCSKGCGGHSPPTGPRTVFIPVESLTLRK